MRAGPLARLASWALLLLAATGAVSAAGPRQAGGGGDAAALSCGFKGRARLVPFASAPFPFEGDMPDGTPFYDQPGPPRGHTSPRGGVYREGPTYSDSRVLLAVPDGFAPGPAAVMVVYLHGNQATLERDVCRRQRIPGQVAASGLNAVLVAPQLAVNALDSSAGRFWQPGAFRAFLTEAARELGRMTGRQGFEDLPVIVVAYSGGYLPAVYAAEVGGIGTRLRAVVLMDALFGEVERYARVVAERRFAFVSAYSASSREQNASLRRLLRDGTPIGDGLPASIRPGTATFVPAGPEVSHNDFMTRAFAPDPLRVLLGRFDAFRGSPRGSSDDR